MPLFICDCCGAVDNTACGGNYWSKNLGDIPDNAPDLCCKCHTGEWHNRFPYEVCTAEVFNEFGEDNFVYEFPVQNPRIGGVIIGGNHNGEAFYVGMHGERAKAVDQMLAFAEVVAAEMALPYHLLGPGGNCRPLFQRTRRRPEQTCQLPGCQNTTRHRGGYCCPEHCREHQAQRGKKVKALGR